MSKKDGNFFEIYIEAHIEKIILGVGGIVCVGMAKPKINHNNIVGNAVGIQAFSTILIDARYNWWGKSPPDGSLIWGDNINLKPWLEGPEEKAFTKD